MLPLLLALAAADPASASSGWALDGGGARCTLSRAADAQTFVLRTLPGSGNYDLMLVSPPVTKALQGGTKAFSLAFAPTGTVLHRAAGALPLGNLGTAAAFNALPPDFLGAMAQAAALSLNVDRTVIATFALPIADKAVAAMRDCEKAKLQQWGADPAAFAPGATQAKAIGNPATWLTANDLGKDNKDKEGYAIFRLTVAVDGSVATCAPLESGNPAFDTLGCAALTGRARYEPAHDAAGKAIVSVVLYTASWPCRRCAVVDAIG